MRPISRPKSRVPVEAMQTFEVAAPVQTHTRPGTCVETDCPHYLRGWKMKIDLGTPLGRDQAHYIKYDSGRKYKVTAQVDGLVELEFPEGQICFRQHRVPLERPAIFRVKGGDHRGNPLRIPTRVHKKPEFWVEEFAENQDRIITAQERG